jgi:hypothetical protein
MEEPSPVVPNSVTLEHPAARLRRACSIIASIMISPWLSNGVARATESPNFCVKYASSQLPAQM